MKHTLFLTTVLAAALLGSGVANAAGTLYASQYGTPDYTSNKIVLGSTKDYDTLVVDVPLTMTGTSGYLNLYDGTTFVFAKENGADAICCVYTPAERVNYTAYFNYPAGSVFNITFDDGAHSVVAASAGTPITLIQDQNMESGGFSLAPETTLKLNGAVVGQTVNMNGVQFTYVGPKEDGYTFNAGEIGFTGYYKGSHALKLAHGGGLPTPEPTTGTLSLLALAGLCARRRRK